MPAIALNPVRRRGVLRVTTRAVAVVGLVTALLSGLAGASPTGSLRIFTLNGRAFGVTAAIHVVTFAGPHYRLRVALAHHAIDGGVQTPRAMCRATPGCLAAVNGDYFALTGPPRHAVADEVGGIIQGCVLVHTPEISHQQANLDTHSLSQNLEWTDTLDVNGVEESVSGINQTLPISYGGVHVALTGTLIYTASYARVTPSAPGRTTYVFSLVGGAAATQINATAQLQLIGWSPRGLRVGDGEVAISAPPSSILTTLHLGQTIANRTRTTGGCDNIGGHPILLDHGALVPVASTDAVMARPFARTVIGWTSSGRTVLVTVDGRDNVAGATASQLVFILRALHVVTALNLDGGNSTTLFARGRTLNTPSLGAERAVSTSLVVVRD